MRTTFVKLTTLLFTLSLWSQIERPVGINLTEVNDWSTEFVFTDAMKLCRPWIPHEATQGSPWDSGVEIPLNQDGYPLEIPYDNGIDPPQLVRTILFTNEGNYHPSGQYRLIVEGQGTISFWGAASGTFNTPIDTLVEVDASLGAVFLEIEHSAASNPISSIKLIFPEYINNYQSQTFTSEFLDFISDFQTLRFMDWLKTNSSINQYWEERTKTTEYSQNTQKGVAWEYIIELCNLTQKNPWINIPHLANDDYITQVAQLLKDNLDPDLTIYLEYSNELWNGIFQQHHDASQMGADLGYTGEPWEITWKFTSKRSADIFTIFENVFGNSNRFIKIIPSQMNDYVANKLIEHFNDPVYNPGQVSADVLAIAPYFGGTIGDEIAESGEYLTITVPEILTLAENSLAEVYTLVSDLKTTANTNQLSLIAYEGGQHLVGNGANADLQILTDKLIAANRHPDMQNIYCQYFDNWYDTQSNGLFTVYSSHYIPNKYGSWGIKEYFDDLDAPKYLSVQNCVFSYNTLNTNTTDIELDLTIYPNPTHKTLFLNNLSSYTIYDITGNEILKGKSNTINVEHFANGLYFIKIENDIKKFIKI